MKVSHLVNHEAYHDKIAAAYADFKAVEAKAIAFYDSLTAPQKSAIMTTLNSWGAATTAQKLDALLAVEALNMVASGYLIRLQIGE